MSYIGKKPSDITRAIANYDTFTGDGSTTTFTLTQGAASANDLTVVVNNVRQEPGSGSKSYTLTAPTSLVFNTAPAASDEIYVINPTQVEAIVRAGDISSGAITGQTAETTPADGDTLIMFDASAGALRKITKANLVTSAAITANTAKVTNATHTGEVTGSTALTIADNAVTLAKMASGTDGNLITYDASGNPAYVATGNAGQILTSAGAGAPPTFAAAPTSGCWEKLDTITISGTTSQIEHEEANFTSTHRDYKIMLSNVALTADATMRMRVATDGGTLGSGTNYKYAMTSYRSNNSTGVEADQDGTAFPLGGATAAGADAKYTQNFEINLYNPLSTTTFFHFSSVGMQVDNNDYAMTHIGGGVYVTGHDVAFKRFVLYLSTGDFNAGTSTLYGRIV